MRGFGIIEHNISVGMLEKEVPSPRLFEGLVEPIAVSPCTSDVHTAYHRKRDQSMNGRILGHESVGRIVALGEGCQEYQVGDVVTVSCTTPNWRTPEVQDSLHQHAGGTFRGMCLSTGQDGVMAERFIVPDIEMNACIVPPEVSIESALMLSDMVTTGFHAAELGEVKYGDSVVVIGTGPVGLMAIIGAKLRGAGRIIAVGSRKACVELARVYGANDVIDYKHAPIAEQVMALTGNKKVDAVLICGGDSRGIETGFAITKANGTIANMVAHSEVTHVSIEVYAANRFVAHQKLTGGLCPGGRRRLERLMSMIQHGRFDPSLMVTHRLYGLDACPEALEMMRVKSEELIKPVVYLSN